MKNHNRSSESGQALILMVLAFIGLLGFAALAIDGGMIYSNRRISQNAGDAASLAGAGQAAVALKGVTGTPNPGTYEGWDCSQITSVLTAAENAAIARAANNDFTITASNDPTTQNRVYVHCVNDVALGKYIDVDVDITHQTPSVFAHFVFNGPLVNTVRSITTVFPKTPIGQGKSIVSLTQNYPCNGNDRGTTFSGSHTVVVDGGGIHSNSCLDLNGFAGSVVVTGTIDYNKDYNNPAGKPVTPTPISTTEVIQTFAVPQVCPSGVNGTNPAKNNIQPGDYGSITVNNNDTLNLASGLYCLTGNFRITGGTVTGHDVTIYLNGGNFTSVGNATIQLDAPPPGCEDTLPAQGGCKPALGGMLIYATTGDVDLEGSASSWYTGTVYAPNGAIDIGGNTSLISTYGVSAIGKDIKIHGTVDMSIKYLPSEMYHRKETLFLKR